MKKQLFAILVLSTLLFSCTKKETVTPTNTQTPCQKNNTGTLSVSSSSNNPYMISIDGVDRGSLPGKATQTYELTAGAHTVKASQESGYAVYPTIKTQNITIVQCQTSGFNY